MVPIVTNAARASIKGGEIELSAKPVGWLTLSATAGYTDANYSSYGDSGVSFVANKLPGAPELTSNVSATVRQPISGNLAMNAVSTTSRG